jgi:amino acid transporter, AAT family
MPVGNHQPHADSVQGGPLKRELGERHIRLMALGACIGVGLFLGSAKAIEMAGPAIMLSYIIGGLAILVIMRALGEMAVHNPVAGSFSRYAQDYLGPLAGFLTGWNYWFLWLVTCVAEITAVAVYMGIWFPDVPRWIWALAALISMGSINLIAVKAFGEFEFWFALIKIVTIIAMVFGGIGIIAFGFGNDGVALGISNLWTHGGFLPNGIQGVLMSLQMVMFAYLGVEMIGLTAGEAKNPQKDHPECDWLGVLAHSAVLRRRIVRDSVHLPVERDRHFGQPVCDDLRASGHQDRGRHHQLCGDYGGPVVVQRRYFQHRAHALQPGAKRPGPGQLRHHREKRGAASGLAAVDRRAVAGRSAQLYGTGEGVCVGDGHCHFRRDLDLADDLLAQLRFRKNLSPQEAAALKYRMWLYPYSSYAALAFLLMVVG